MLLDSRQCYDIILSRVGGRDEGQGQGEGEDVVPACYVLVLCPHVCTVCLHVGTVCLYSDKLCLHTVPVKFDTKLAVNYSEH